MNEVDPNANLTARIWIVDPTSASYDELSGGASEPSTVRILFSLFISTTIDVCINDACVHGITDLSPTLSRLRGSRRCPDSLSALSAGPLIAPVYDSSNVCSIKRVLGNGFNDSRRGGASRVYWWLGHRIDGV